MTEQSLAKAYPQVLRAAIGLGVYAGVFGATFGAVSVSSGLTVGQTMILSLVMFSGASQFAFVGVAAAGSPWAAIPAAATPTKANCEAPENITRLKIMV